MNLHIFSIGYEFSHDVAYKAHIFGFFGRVDGGMCKKLLKHREKYESIVSLNNRYRYLYCLISN